MRFKPRSVYDVLALISFFLVVGGGTALASYVISSNSQVGSGTISGHKPPSGDHANIIRGSVNGQDIVESSLGPVPNADRLDGQDSTAFGQVRDFSRTIAAASAGPPIKDMLTFHGLTLSSEGLIESGPTLDCQLYASAADTGEFDNALIFTVPGPSSSTKPYTSDASTPVNHFFIGEAQGGDSRGIGELVFRNAATGRVLTVDYAVYVIAAADINNQGCTWQGTVTAAG